MQIGVPAETLAGETRVAVTPETVKKLVAQGHAVRVQSGAGVAASVTDAAYVAAGATITDAASAFPSTTARLIPVVTPIVIQAPTNSMTNVVASTVTLSATIFGSPAPFYWIWRSNSSIVIRCADSETQ